MTDNDTKRIDVLSNDMTELRTQFQQLNNRILELEQRSVNDYAGFSKTEIVSSRMRLMRSYRVFAILSAGLMFIMPGTILNSHIFPELHFPENLILTIMFAAYFLICAIMNIFLYRKLSMINIATMTMKEISARGLSIRRTHHIFQCCLIPYVIGLLSFFAYTLRAEPIILIGMATGGIAGGIIGYVKYRKMMSEYKRLIIE